MGKITKKELKELSEELESLAGQIVEIGDKIDGLAVELNEVQER